MVFTQRPAAVGTHNYALRAGGGERTVLLDMEVIVRHRDHERCASITCMIRHYVARRAQVTEGHPHNAADRASGGTRHRAFRAVRTHARHGPHQLRDDLSRFIFLLGGGGERLFGP